MRKLSWPRHEFDGLNILDVLCLARNNQATDPRDKVFALLPMLEFTTDGLLLAADYGKSTAEIYLDTAVWLLQRVGLSFLSCCRVMSYGENSRAILDGLPSWVPDWSATYLERYMVGIGEVYTPLRAGGDLTIFHRGLDLPETVATIVLDAETRKCGSALLKVRGISVDKIRFVSGEIDFRYPGDNYYKDFVEKCRSYRKNLDGSFEDAAEGHMELAGLARLPTPQQWTPKKGGKEFHPPDRAAYEYGLPLKGLKTLTDLEVSDHINFLTVNRQLAMTDRGYFGVVPPGSAIGDHVLFSEHRRTV